MKLSSYIAKYTSLPGDVRKTRNVDKFRYTLENPPSWWLGLTIGFLPFIFVVTNELFDMWLALFTTGGIGIGLYVVGIAVGSLIKKG